MTETPAIGVIGGGMIAQVAHLPFYLADPHCRVVGIAESRPSLVAALHDNVPDVPIVSDHAELLSDSAVDAVVISAPRSATGALTLAALEAGKHVLAEKPMAHTVAQAETLVGAARDRGLIYAVGYMKRYDPGIVAGKACFRSLVETNAAGPLLSARFFDYSRTYCHAPPPHTRPRESREIRFESWPFWPDWLAERHREPYAWFMNHGSHDVNLMTDFLGADLTVTDARAMPGGVGVEAALTTGDVPVSLTVTKTDAGRWLEGAEFVFEDARLAIDVPSPMDTDAVSRVTLDAGAAVESMPGIDVGRGWSFANQAHAFVDCLRGEAVPATDGEAGLKDLRLCETIWRSISA